MNAAVTGACVGLAAGAAAYMMTNKKRHKTSGEKTIFCTAAFRKNEKSGCYGGDCKRKTPLMGFFRNDLPFRWRKISEFFDSLRPAAASAGSGSFPI